MTLEVEEHLNEWKWGDVVYWRFADGRDHCGIISDRTSKTTGKRSRALRGLRDVPLVRTLTAGWPAALRRRFEEGAPERWTTPGGPGCITAPRSSGSGYRLHALPDLLTQGFRS